MKLCTHVRLANGIFILGMFILTAAYSGSLISFFSVKVFPSMPRTIDDMAKFVMDNDLNVHVCCKHINDTMMDSSSDSFITMTEEERVSCRKRNRDA